MADNHHLRKGLSAEFLLRMLDALPTPILSIFTKEK